MSLAGTVINGVVVLDPGRILPDGTRMEVLVAPVPPSSSLKVEDLNRFLQGLPRLGDDAAAFSDAVLR